MDHHLHLPIPLKKPKLEPVDPTVTNGPRHQEPNHEEEEGEQEEALIALIDHRTHEVEHNKHRLAYYKSQLELSERRLKDSQSQLSRLRLAAKSSSSYVAASAAAAANESPSKSRPPQARPQLIIPTASTRNVAAANPVEKVRMELVAKAAPLSSEKKRVFGKEF